MILLVEDNQDDAAIIVGELEKQLPADCICHAASGAEALELLSRWDGEPLQLVLLGLQSANPSGLEVLEKLRETDKTSHVPVVMLSSADDLNDVAKSYDLGANSVIRKTDDANSFADTISQIAPYWLQLNHPYIRPGVKR